MKVRCPHCRAPIDLPSDTSLSDITCPSCGSSFGLLGEDETASFKGTETKTLGHFELIEQIGLGSFGCVWRARDTELDRTVAVKIPRKGQLDPAETELFLREARAAAQLRHPNIVSVHEVGREADTVFIVSDHIDGVTLDEWLTGKRLTAGEAAELCAKIADALHHAHEAGIVHRDLKPGNIMLDADGVPHIMDFGLARREAGEVTITVEGRVLGTPAYMSPEQAKGEAHQADRRSDVYSLGVILFELLTGERPFRGSARMLLHQIIHDDAPSPRKLAATTPRDLETICQKCLEKEPDKRYSTAKDLRDDLCRFHEGKAIVARPIGRLGLTWRWCKRNPVVASLSVTVAAMLLVGVSFSWYIAVREARQARIDGQNALRLTLEKAWSLPEQGRIAEGMLWMVRCLRIVPQEQTSLHEAIRANLAAWYEHLHPLQAVVVPSSGDHVSDAKFIRGGSHIVATSRSGQIQVWNAKTVKPIKCTLLHPEGIRALAVSRDGKRFLTCGADKTARLWDAKTLQQLGRNLQHDGTVTSACFSLDGSLVVTGSTDARARLWDTNTQRMIGNPFEHKSAVGNVAFEKDGLRFMTFDQEGFHLWHTKTRERIGDAKLYEAHVFSLQFSPTEPRFLVGSQDQTVRVRDASTRDSVGVAFDHPEPVLGVTYSSDGLQAVTGCYDNMARRWDLQTGERLDSPMPHPLPVLSVDFSPDQSRVVTACEDGAIRFWKVPARRRSGPLVQGGMVRGVAFSPDGRYAATASSNGTVREWDVATMKPFGAPTVVSSEYACAVAYSPDGSRILIGASGGVRQWDRRSNEWISPLLITSASTVDVAYSPDGRSIFTAWEGNLRNAANGELLHSLGYCHAAVFSRDGSRILTSSDSSAEEVCVWDSRSGRNLLRLGDHEGIPWAVGFGPEGKRLLVGTRRGVLQIWDAETGAPVTGPLRQHESSIRRAAFSPDGEWIVTASHDRTARLWDAATGRTIGPPMKHPGPVKAVAINPEGTHILTGDGDGNAWIWDAPPPAIRGDVKRIKLWVQVVTAMELLEDKPVRLLDRSEWIARRQELAELDGPTRP